MATIVKMPKLGTTMTEGTIVKWLKNEGDPVKKGEIYVEIQTDKVNIEDEAETSGVLRKIMAKEGETIKVGEPIAIIAEADEESPDLGIADNISTQNQEKSPQVFQQEDKTEAVKQTISDKIKASPAAKRVARENQIDLSKVTPSGPNGRIVERDVLSYIQEHKVKATPVAKKIAIERQVDLKAIQKSPGQRITKQDLEDQIIQDVDNAVDNTIPVIGMRKIIADSMTYSKKVAPHIYLSLEVDMSKVIDLRERLIPLVQAQHDVKLSYNHILIKAAATALRLNPLINSSFTEEKIILKQHINIGLAVALEDGLIVPVIKDADKKGLAFIAKETEELIQKAKSKKLLPDEYHGGTFTITNLGMFDIESFCAIINQPEAAILAVGKIIKKPVVIDDEITIKPMMNLTLSCDHRVIDGAVGAKFLQNLKQILEEPINMLL
ncbi:2-oxo acid dehydrogenase subunit E2 [Tepidanaerobacter sp. GT38]|uniref:dihydrolipoamide acetyltransferase family protein n=1 Tax=Tepidanaerobacter sp. GT38 TaxID=2722793 RepID=UPI001F2CBC7B|nr:dihydrolipoamide acetyltransferase family protein [Tepidanaerobacter sp. GT38]MCG1012573.1 2-oxo acid dehydrogenase subunit E2 [Tepidanaerobacter sp. GT38]